MNKPLVSIIIPTYKRKDMLIRLLKSITLNDYKTYEVIIIDDASPDNTYTDVTKLYKNNKKIKIIRNKKNLFAAGAKNEGQKIAKGKYLLFIDDDNVIDKKMILELVAVLENNNEIGQVAPINYNFNNKKLILLSRSTRNMWTTKTLHLRTLKPFDRLKIWEGDDAPNAYMVRGDVVRKNKIIFDQNYGIMYEESDYAYKIKKLGYKMFMVRNAKIYHDIEDLSNKKNKKDYLYHFLTDPRRSFTFARNRIVFHNTYSSRIQKIGIYAFWVWFFSVYYIYKFLFYRGYGNFNLNTRITIVFNYLKGTIIGYKILFTGK